MLLQTRKIYCVQRGWLGSSGRCLCVSGTLKRWFSLQIFRLTHCLRSGAHCCMVCCALDWTSFSQMPCYHYRNISFSATRSKTWVMQKYVAGHSLVYASSWWELICLWEVQIYWRGEKWSMSPALPVLHESLHLAVWWGSNLLSWMYLDICTPVGLDSEAELVENIFFMFQLSSNAAVSAWVWSSPAVVESPEEDLRQKGSLPSFSLYRSSACIRKGHVACLTQRSVRSLGAESCLRWGFVPFHSCSLAKVSCGNGKVPGGTCSMCNVSCLFLHTHNDSSQNRSIQEKQSKIVDFCWEYAHLGEHQSYLASYKTGAKQPGEPKI